MIKGYKRLTSEILHENPYWSYMHDTYSLQDNQQKADYFYVNSLGSTIIIPCIDEQHFVLVHQYRYLNQKYSLEFPGGGIPQEVQPQQNASKELKEETGYVAEYMEHIGTFNPYKGVTNELCYVFVAKNLQAYSSDPEKTEDIRTTILHRDEIVHAIKKGEIWDGMTLAAWTLFFQL